MTFAAISQFNTEIVDPLCELKEEVFKKRTVLGKLYYQKGKLSLLSFAKQQFTGLGNNAIPQERKFEIIQEIVKHTERILGSSVAHAVAVQLQEQYAVITANHNGIQTDVGYFNSDLLTGIHLLNQPNKNKKIILILSCTNLSFDNKSFPRGHLFHSAQGEKIITNQLVFFPRKVRPLTILHYPAYTKEAIVEAKKRIDEWMKEGAIQKKQKEQLNVVIDEIYADPSVLNFTTFTDQATKTNFGIWEKLFASVPNKPSLVLLAQEEIVNNLITKYHLYQETTINKLLFNPKYHDAIIRYFDGIMGAFDLKKNYGTFLFWAIPKNQKYKVQLWKKGDQLVSPDNSYIIDLKPEVIEKAIKNGELIPSTFLSLTILSFYYGLTLMGGGSQTSYLTKMKKAYLLMCAELEEDREILLSEKVPTNRQCVPYPSLAFLDTNFSENVAATPLDILLYADAGYLSTFEANAKTMTFKLAVEKFLLEIYHMYISQYEQKSNLLALSQADIDHATGFNEQIRTCGRIE